MERDIWRIVVAALKRLPPTCKPKQLYTTAEVLAVLLWAALYDRSILWACRRRSWPVQAWRRRLPDQSTMSRRLRDPALLEHLTRVLDIIQRAFDDGDNSLLRIDGKPLSVSVFSDDRDATMGWGAGIYARGYKLHAIVANARRIVAFIVEPMGVAECTTGEKLIEQAAKRVHLKPDTLVLGDPSYDTNALHKVAREHGTQLLAGRRRPGTALSKGHAQDPGRVVSTQLLEGDEEVARWQRNERAAIEHFFGGLSSASGLYALPPWTRTLGRVRVWVYAKVALNAARIARTQARAA